jgi:predicted AAA+ superfamily ATPase
LSEPDTTLRSLKKLVVIDEIQRRPALFPLLRVLADRSPLPARFLILGSAAPDLLRQSSETLAGRLETVPLEGFRLADLARPRSPGIGCVAVSHFRTPRAPRPTRWPGGISFYRRFWSGICRSWG